ncbi:hypothetical protein KI387_020850, partial [Taxus chinensis]
MVDVAGVTDVADAVVIAGIGPSCKMNHSKVEAGSAEPDGVDTGVGTRAEGIDT